MNILCTPIVDVLTLTGRQLNFGSGECSIVLYSSSPPASHKYDIVHKYDSLASCYDQCLPACLHTYSGWVRLVSSCSVCVCVCVCVYVCLCVFFQALRLCSAERCLAYMTLCMFNSLCLP